MSVNSRNRTEYEIKRARRRFVIIFLAAVVANMRSKIVNLISSNNQQIG